MTQVSVYKPHWCNSGICSRVLGTVPLCIQSSAAREPVLHLSHDWITDTEETGLEFGFHQEGDLNLKMWEFQQKLKPE